MVIQAARTEEGRPSRHGQAVNDSNFAAAARRSFTHRSDPFSSASGVAVSTAESVVAPANRVEASTPLTGQALCSVWH